MVINMERKISKSTVLIWIMATLLLCSWGGIYDFNMAFYGVCVCAGLFFQIKRKRCLEVGKNSTAVAMLLLLAGSVISTIAAADKGIAFIGVIRMAVLCLICLFWHNLRTMTREKIWKGMTDIVAMVTLITMLGYFIPYFRELFFHAGRYGGVLQYSNTYACLLLLFLIVLIFHRKGNWTVISYIQATVFCVGIIWSGSRSVFVLLVIALVALLLYFRRDVQWKAVGIIGVILIAAVIVSVTLLKLDIAHLFKLSLSSSTLNGRILYWRDGSEQLLRHPQGLGYMGYYFWQPQFQTGNYITKYVHNDILQFGLDSGWIAMMGIVWLFIGNIFRKNNTVRNRFVLIFLLLHALFDFDLQFGFMFCILLMCTDGDSYETAVLQNRLKSDGRNRFVLKPTAAYGMTVAGLAVGIYLSLAFGSSYFGNHTMALAMYPGNTFALESKMTEEEDVTAAEKIIKQNGLLASAYEYRAMDLIRQGNYEDAYDAVCDMLNCAGYQSEYYDMAVYELSYCLQGMVKADKISQAQKVLQKIQEMPQIIEAQENKATQFAYRINDKPEIELSDEITAYIDKLQDVTLT